MHPLHPAPVGRPIVTLLGERFAQLDFYPGKGRSVGRVQVFHIGVKSCPIVQVFSGRFRGILDEHADHTLDLAGQQSLRVNVRLPGTDGIRVELPPGKRDWHAFTHLVVSVYVPRDAPRKIQALVYLKDTDLYYYQHLRRNYLRPGRWTHLRIDLTATSSMWQFKDHYKPWDGYCRQDVQQLGVKFVSEARYEGHLYVDRIELKRDPAAVPAQNAIYNLRANETQVGRYQKFELSFNVARTYSNPFDPEEVDVQGRFIRPDGTEVRVPGFFYQGYLRRMEKGAEKLAPMGRSQWKIRFAPLQTGAYHYQIEINDSQPIRSEMGRFQCVDSDSPGFVRISKQDPLFFEFDDGSPFYPIGHNIAAVHDARARVLGVNIPASEGTYAYDRILGRMGQAGENFGRVWMSPWSFGIEWTKAYDIHFRDLGRYNLLNAWRLDHVLRTAEENGISIMLLFTAHGEIGDYESDFWGYDKAKRQGSPYWSRYGGPVGHPRELYTTPAVLKFYQRKVRYIVARWGYSPAVMAWEVLNEPDLPGFYQNDTYGRLGAAFVRAVAQQIRGIDPARHLVTSGCFRYRQSYAHPTMSLPELDFNTGHIFDGNLEQRLVADLRYMQDRYKKIFLPTEAGLTPFAQDPQTTALAIHRTLWSSFMTPAAGAAAPWWWVLIDQRDLYGEFAALSAFARGEDRRGKGYGPGTGMAVDDARQRQLRALVLAGRGQAFCWVFNPRAFASRSEWEESPEAPAMVTIHNLEPGAYSVEIWDTREGRIIGRLDASAVPVRARVGPGVLTFKTPPFKQDVACKLIRKDEQE